MNVLPKGTATNGFGRAQTCNLSVMKRTVYPLHNKGSSRISHRYMYMKYCNMLLCEGIIHQSVSIGLGIPNRAPDWICTTNLEVGKIQSN